MKKKILSFLLLLCFCVPCVFGLTACEGNNNPPTTYTVNETTWKDQFGTSLTNFVCVSDMKGSNWETETTTTFANQRQYTKIKTVNGSETTTEESYYEWANNKRYEYSKNGVSGVWSKNELNGDDYQDYETYVANTDEISAFKAIINEFARFTYDSTKHVYKATIKQDTNTGEIVSDDATSGYYSNVYEIKFENGKLVSANCTVVNDDGVTLSATLKNIGTATVELPSIAN